MKPIRKDKFLIAEIDKLIDEISITAAAPGYQTPKAFQSKPNIQRRPLQVKTKRKKSKR